MATGQAISGDQLRRARLRKGWTVRDVEQRCRELGVEVDNGNISKYERGVNRPRPRTLLVLAQALDSAVDDFLLPAEASGSDAA